MLKYLLLTLLLVSSSTLFAAKLQLSPEGCQYVAVAMATAQGTRLKGEIPRYEATPDKTANRVILYLLPRIENYIPDEALPMRVFQVFLQGCINAQGAITIPTES